MRFKEERFIRQRFSKSTNTWTFQVIIRDPEKGTITKSFSEKTYGSARRAYDTAIAFRNETMVQLKNGAIIKKQNATIEDVLYESFMLFPVREMTKKKHIVLFNKYISGWNCPISSANKTMVIESLNAMIRESSNDTIQKVLGIWKKIAKTALVKDYITYDFASGIVAPKSQRIEKPKREVMVDRHTFDKVLEAIREKFYPSEAEIVCMALELMWHTGLRPAECFALEKSDIQNGIVNVSKELGSDIADDSTKIDYDNIGIVRKCKTEASIRQVPITDNLQRLLDNYHVEGKILFPTRKGGYFNLSNLGGRIRNLGIPFNMYQLRHSVATRLITNNVDQRTIIEILGHENISMSVYYARSNSDLKKEALSTIS